jgi:hypothetical protein
VLDSVIILLIVAALAPYIIGPILVYVTQQWPVKPVLSPYDPIRHPLPDDLAAAFMDSREALARQGYALRADLAHENPKAKIQLRIALLEDGTRGDLALVAGARSTNPKVKITACHVEFLTKFADGSTLTVTNTQDPEVYAEVAGRTIERFPQVRDPARLQRVNRALLERSFAGREPQRLEMGQDPAAFVRDAMDREYRHQIGAGLLRLDEGRQMYRPTWRGAWLMTWRLLPPLRQVIRARRLRRATALLAALGLAGSDEHPIAAPSTSDPLRWNLAILALLALLYLLVRNSGTQSAAIGQPPDFALPAAFTVPSDFAGAVRALEGLAGDTAAPLLGNDADGEPRPIEGVSVGVTADSARGIVRAAAELFRARGFLLFIAESNFGIAPDRLALFPRADPYEVLGLMGTNGANYDIDTDSIVTWLRALERDHPFVLEGIGFDWLGGRFTADLEDADGVARRLYAICPDVVTQGVGSVRALARTLRRERTLYCWWD